MSTETDTNLPHAYTVDSLIARLSSSRQETYEWSDAAREISPHLGELDMHNAQKKLVKLISYSHPRSILSVVAKLTADLGDEQRGDIDKPYDVGVLQSLGLFESVYGTVHFDINKRNFLNLAALADLRVLRKKRENFEWELRQFGHRNHSKILDIKSEERWLGQFKRHLRQKIKPTSPAMRK